MYVEVSFVHPISNPIKPHVNSFTTFLLNSIVSNPRGAKVFRGDGCWWLGMAKFGEDNADYLYFICVEEEGAKFCFDGEGKHIINDNREKVDRSVEG